MTMANSGRGSERTKAPAAVDAPKMADFTLIPRDDWRRWEIYHGDALVMEVDRETARAAMLGQYDPAALARGELVQR